MSDTWTKILAHAQNGELRVSSHGYEELAADDITAREAIAGLGNAQIVEDYPSYHKGACVLVLQFDTQQRPIHVLCGIPKGKDSPAVLITAYRPDPARWTSDFQRRKDD